MEKKMKAPNQHEGMPKIKNMYNTFIRRMNVE